jgi:L-fuconolactonase
LLGTNGGAACPQAAAGAVGTPRTTDSRGNLPLDRRRFLTVLTAAAAWAGGTAGCRTNPRKTDALPAVPESSKSLSLQARIVDTHTHFYDPTRPQGVPWPPKEDALLYRTVLPEDYLALPVPQPVTGTVVVEASPWIEDNQWVLELAARTPFIQGLVGNLPVGTAAFAGHLDRFARHPLFRGIRIRDRKLEGALEESRFVGDLKRLAEHDLSLDLVGGLEILGFADRLSRELPGLRIVLDHLAGVRIDGKAPPADWERQMRAISRQPHVYAKLSGLVEGTGRTDGAAPREVAHYRPVLEVMWDAFGPHRLLYASNWPVSERFAPLATVQGIVQDFAREHGPEAEAAVMAGTARTAYGLVERPGPGNSPN